MIQEAVTNIVKHSNAAHTWISLVARDGSLIGEIRDDGVGFDVTETELGSAGGWAVGLLGMSERVNLLGGKLEIVSSPGAGTAVRFTIPISQESVNG